MEHPGWISRLRDAGLVAGDFVPFRYWDRISLDSNGIITGYWAAWFVDPGIKRLRKTGESAEIAGDDLAEYSDEPLFTNMLNRKEENDYRIRIEQLPIGSLQQQLDLWQELQDRAPMRTYNLNLVLIYPPIEYLKRLIQKKLVEQASPDRQVDKLKKFGHGELKKKIQSLIDRDECTQYETVSSSKVAKWVREIIAEGYQTTESTIRAKLSKMGYSTER